MRLFLDWFTLTIQRHPAPLRSVLRVMDKVAPAALRRRALANARAVHAVFERPEDFLMGIGNAPKLKLGPFLLGMDPGPQYDREKRLLTQALARPLEVFPAIAAHESRRYAERMASELHAGKRLNLIAEFVEPVYVRAIAHCFGVPVQNCSSEWLDTKPGDRTLALFIRTLGATIGSSHPAPFGLEELAEQVAGEFAVYLRDAISLHRSGAIARQLERHADGSPLLAASDTVLGRLLREQARTGSESFSDGDWGIVRSLGGLLSASAGFPKAFAHALHELLRRLDRPELQKLAAAARRGDKRCVDAYVLEALRFRPVYPMLTRYCPRSTALPELHAKAGTQLAIFPLAAMFDPVHVERPEQFLPGRPAGSYSVFGHGPRACLGEALMMALFTPMLGALFEHAPQLLEVEAGEFRYDGAALERYELRLPGQPGDELCAGESAPAARPSARQAPPLAAAEPSSDARESTGELAALFYPAARAPELPLRTEPPR